MSTTDTMTPLVSAPWFDADGNPLPVRALPGLRPEVVRGLECSYPGIIHPTLRALLETCCGLASEVGAAMNPLNFFSAPVNDSPAAPRF